MIMSKVERKILREEKVWICLLVFFQLGMRKLIAYYMHIVHTILKGMIMMSWVSLKVWQTWVSFITQVRHSTPITSNTKTKQTSVTYHMNNTTTKLVNIYCLYLICVPIYQYTNDQQTINCVSCLETRLDLGLTILQSKRKTSWRKTPWPNQSHFI